MTLTDWFIIVWVLSIAVYDIWCVLNKRKNDTVSHRVVIYSRRWPWFAPLLLLFVVLCLGHWFIPYGLYWPWRQPVFVPK